MRLRNQAEAHAPSGHGVGFGQRARYQHGLFRARQRRDRERRALVEEVAVAFVGKQIDSASRCEVIDLLELLRGRAQRRSGSTAS